MTTHFEVFCRTSGLDMRSGIDFGNGLLGTGHISLLIYMNKYTYIYIYELTSMFGGRQVGLKAQGIVTKSHEPSRGHSSLDCQQVASSSRCTTLPEEDGVMMKYFCTCSNLEDKQKKAIALRGNIRLEIRT